ncbi:UNVERIFIED_CONTAM: hypothetical protein K2H54_051560 [Gekko kuhli]
MAESQKKGGGFKKKFLRFKGFGSLSSIPWAFSFRRVSVAPSVLETPRGGHLSSNGFLEPTIESTQDDLNTMPKSPSPYARSCDMYSHMGTMPRASCGRSGKRDKAKAREISKDRIQDAPLPAVPEPCVTVVAAILKKEVSLPDEESELQETLPPKENPSPACSQMMGPVALTTISKSFPELGQLGEGTGDKAKGHELGLLEADGIGAEEHIRTEIPEKNIVSQGQMTEEKNSQENAKLR